MTRRRIAAVAVGAALLAGSARGEDADPAAKLAAARVAYATAVGAAAIADKLAAMREAELQLGLILSEDPDSDLAKAIASGQAVAGLDFDSIRLEASKLQAFADTENTLTYLARENGLRTLCWTFERRFCENARADPPYANAAYADFEAGFITTAEITQDPRLTLERRQSVRPRELAAHLFQHKPLAARITQKLRPATTPQPATLPPVLNAVLQPLRDGDKAAPLIVDGVNIPYLRRSVTISLPPEDKTSTLGGADGARRRSLTFDQVIIPSLSPGVVPLDDFQQMRAGRLVVAKVNGLDALLVAGTFARPAASPAETDARVRCVLDRLKSLPPLSPEQLAPVQQVVAAANPIAKLRELAGSAEGERLQQNLDRRWQPVADACLSPAAPP